MRPSPSRITSSKRAVQRLRLARDNINREFIHQKCLPTVSGGGLEHRTHRVVCRILVVSPSILTIPYVVSASNPVEHSSQQSTTRFGFGVKSRPHRSDPRVKERASETHSSWPPSHLRCTHALLLPPGDAPSTRSSPDEHACCAHRPAGSGRPSAVHCPGRRSALSRLRAGAGPRGPGACRPPPAELVEAKSIVSRTVRSPRSRSIRLTVQYTSSKRRSGSVGVPEKGAGTCEVLMRREGKISTCEGRGGSSVTMGPGGCIQQLAILYLTH